MTFKIPVEPFVFPWMITMESPSLGHKNTKLHAIPATIKQKPHSVTWWLGSFPLMPPREGGGGYSHNGPNGKAPPERGTFSTFFFSHTTFIKPTRVCDRVDRPTQNPLQSYGVGLTTGILIWKGTAYNNPQGGTMPEWGSFIRLQGIWKGREISDFST